MLITAYMSCFAVRNFSMRILCQNTAHGDVREDYNIIDDLQHGYDYIGKVVINAQFSVLCTHTRPNGKMHCKGMKSSRQHSRSLHRAESALRRCIVMGFLSYRPGSRP